MYTGINRNWWESQDTPTHLFLSQTAHLILHNSNFLLSQFKKLGSCLAHAPLWKNSIHSREYTRKKKVDWEQVWNGKLYRRKKHFSLTKYPSNRSFTKNNYNHCWILPIITFCRMWYISTLYIMTDSVFRINKSKLIAGNRFWYFWLNPASGNT